MSGIADVARLAGVSKSTASRALTGGGYVSDLTRQRVTDAAASLGYVPSTSAVSLATGRTRTIALIVPKVNRWYFGSIVEGVERTLIPLGYDVTLYVASRDPTTARACTPRTWPASGSTASSPSPSSRTTPTSNASRTSASRW